MSLPILTTKLHIPTPRTELVIRPHLLNQLNDGLQRKLTLISAPAGFGKTSLASEWVAQVNHSVAWLSLDPADREPNRFLAYLIAAIQTAMPTIGHDLLETLQSSQTVPPEFIATILINQIAANDSKLMLVLDDYHLLDTKPINTILSFLLDHLPPNMHLVLVTREDPPLPLARLRAQKQMTELRVRDLRFALDESADFLNQTMGLTLSAEEIAILEARTEGWITGLQLAALALQQKSASPNQAEDTNQFIQNFTGSQHYVLDYLIEEILQHQPEHIRLFLIHTSILDRLNGQICDAVAEQENSAELLETLERNNMFIIPLDEQRHWYRYHHLFADVLHASLLKTAPDQLSKLHQRASNWYEQHGVRTVAIEHALKGQHFTHAATLIEQEWPTVQRTFEYTTFLMWIRALPDAVITNRPVLCMAFGWALIFEGDLQRANEWLSIASDWLNKDEKGEMVVTDEAEFHHLPATLMTARTIHAQTSGQLDETIRYGQQALALLPTDDHIRRAVPSGILGLAYWTKGDLRVAHKQIVEARAHMRQTGDIYNTVGLAPVLAHLAFARGQLRQAIHTCEDALAMNETSHLVQEIVNINLTLSALYLEQYNLEKAIDYLSKNESIRQQPMYGVNYYDDYRNQLVQAYLRQVEGDLDGASELLGKAEQIYRPTVLPNLRPVAAIKARLCLVQNHLGKAVDWVNQRGLSATDEPSYLQEYEHLTLVRVLIAQYHASGEEATIAQAVALLDRLQQAAKANQRLYSLIEIFILQALIAQAQTNLDDAVGHLERALPLAEPDGYIRIFIDAGQPLVPPLKEARKRGIKPAFASRILAIYEATDQTHLERASKQNESKQPVVVSPENRLFEQLTERELDVLHLFKTELSGPEIARELVVALSTVRTHTKGIYRKLDVNSRRAAVKRAEELNLL